MNIDNGKSDNVINCSKIDPTILRINPKDDNKIAICGNKGSILFYDIKTKSSVYGNHTENYSIEDAQWHPAENYFIASYCDGTIKLFEGFKETASYEFEAQNTGVKAMNWLNDRSGDFLTSSLKAGVLKMWNASQKVPKRTIKVGIQGVRAFEGFNDDVNLYVLVYKEGSLGVLNM